MNILHLISSKGYFGAENVAINLTKGINRKRGFKSVIGIIIKEDEYKKEIEKACKKYDIKRYYIKCGNKINLSVILEIRKILFKDKINILHSHGYKADIYNYLATINTNVKKVATCHNWLGDSYKMSFYSLIDRFALKKFDYVVAVSAQIREILINSKIPKEKISIISNGIDINEFKNISASIRSDLGIKDNEVVIGTIGRLSEEKGHKHLLNISRSIFKEHPFVIFLIIGDGNLKNYYEKKYSEQFIIFTGFRTDIAALLRSMDIFVLPSLTEGLPIALLEAMAAKLPIVASDVGAIPMVVKNNESGYLVPPGNEKVLKRSILSLVKNKEKREKFGGIGYSIVENEFSEDKTVNSYLNLYSRVACHNMKIN